MATATLHYNLDEIAERVAYEKAVKDLILIKNDLLCQPQQQRNEKVYAPKGEFPVEAPCGHILNYRTAKDQAYWQANRSKIRCFRCEREAKNQ